jgi:hypothetical protein
MIRLFMFARQLPEQTHGRHYSWVANLAASRVLGDVVMPQFKGIDICVLLGKVILQFAP